MIKKFERGEWRSVNSKATKIFEVNNDNILEIQDAKPNYVEN